MAPQTTLMAHLAFSCCAYKTTCSVAISSHGLTCESNIVVSGLICLVKPVHWTRFTNCMLIMENTIAHYCESTCIHAASEVDFLFFSPHKNLNMIWSPAPLKASENQITTTLWELEFMAKPTEVNHVCNWHIMLRHDLLEVNCENCLAIIFLSHICDFMQMF